MQSRQSLFFSSLLLVLLVASIFLFYGGPGAYAMRSVKELWNLGHVLYFMLLVILVAKLLKSRGLSNGWIWIWSILLTLLWGGAIEILQQGGDRNPDIMDVLRGLSGALLALVLLPGSVKIFHRRLQNLICYAVFGIFGVVLVPLAVAVSDEVIAATQFPVLSNFETPFELDRWKGKAAFEIVESVEGTATSAMQVSLDTEETYTGVGMQYFIGDWSSYKFLNIDIYYPKESPLRLTVKVYDTIHRSVEPTHLYHDRFNGVYQLKHGWNYVRVPLREIRTAPENREMDMSSIAGLQLFAVRLQQPRTIFLDRIYLSD